MTTLRDIQNLPKRRYRTVNDLSHSLIKVVGLPWQYQRRIERAERLIHLCNPIVRSYHSLAITCHRLQHKGLFRKCQRPQCVQALKLIDAWGIDRKAMQSGKNRKSRATG